MGWSWGDLQTTPTHIVLEGFELMKESADRKATQQSASELRLRALKAAKKQRGR